jgi:hypothetical protein
MDEWIEDPWTTRSGGVGSGHRRPRSPEVSHGVRLLPVVRRARARALVDQAVATFLVALPTA